VLPSYCCDILEEHDTWHLFCSWEHRWSGKACLGPWWLHLLLLQAQGSSLWSLFHHVYSGSQAERAAASWEKFFSWLCWRHRRKHPPARAHFKSQLSFFNFFLLYGSIVAEPACSAGAAGDMGSIPGSGRSPGRGHGNPFQYSWASLVSQKVKNLPTTQEI